MRITVALRIIAGFTLVTLLLLLLGGMSLWSMNRVGEQTRSFQQFTLPAKDGASALERGLAAQQLTLLASYHSQSPAEQGQHTSSAARQHDEMQAQLDLLTPLLASQPQSQAILEQFQQQYQRYQQASDQLHRARQSALQQQVALQQQLGQLEDLVDDSSSILLDVMDLEFSDNAQDQQMAGQANMLDTDLNGLFALSLELPLQDSLERVDTLQGELAYLISSSALLTQDLLEQNAQTGGQVLSGNTLNELTGYLGQIREHFHTETGLTALQRQQVEAQQQASAARDQAQALWQQLQQSLDGLQAQVLTVSNQAAAAAESAISDSRVRTLLVMLLSIVAASLIGFVTIRAITRPLNQVNNALSVLAQGDLTEQLSYPHRDEFGRLVGNTNKLVNSLQGLVKAIMDRSNQLATAAEETSAITAQTTSGIQEQRSQVEQVASATTELSASATQVATRANDTLGEIKLADDEAQQVRQLSVENGETIQALAREVEQASSVIHKLHADSAAIGGILDVIRGIADQTNLLALNAAIEAARAGEQGRGFAVVADEVRSLASRTQDSTTEIQEMIEVLQQGAQQAVSVMEQGQQQAQQSVAKTEEASRMLESIAQAVERVYSAGNQISQAAREQDQVSQNISERLDQIAGIAEETSTGAIQTASSSQQVAQLAEELQGEVRRFRV
ncbi:methyl-accepting chemotaxis protein [Ferrimonas marina]|uniref:Methyl-accepting chemotaxis protein n=1 Tax=Ferrimonas marina TaxID=299255 RepID=A0A1M5ZKU4_9GAMM|nr:methyl-accepting chemotaxis protein [Ferrimonas marina]SHI24816.1 methyl-accepting chemotaxis protein [Ferrimonas marina]